MAFHYLACDLGAESGRLMLGSIDDGHLSIEEIHRFPNTPARVGESLQWNLKELWRGLLEGLRLIARRGLPIAGISADSWGVDYVLINADGELLEPAYHYRDPRCQAAALKTHARLSWKEMFAETGVQFMPFNTVYQLASEAPSRLQSARHALGIGDAFNYLLSGVQLTELSFASTTQLYNPTSRGWSQKIISALGYPIGLFSPIVSCGTPVGPLLPAIREETGLGAVEVIASCSHDTAAAVAAVPATARNWAYLSSGTWSLMGVELDQPNLSPQCREFNFTNEIGYGHSVRLLKNIVGLWLVQECRRHWSSQGATHDYDYAELAQLAAQSPAFVSLINPSDPRFIAPGDMPLKIASFCRETGQSTPRAPGATLRCIFESLALLYRHVLAQFATLLGRSFDTLHIVGGGSKNILLNQFTANATRTTVVAGPAEATAAGNILVQALALDHLPSLAAARQLVKRSSQLIMFHPEDLPAWDQAYERFRQLP